MGAGRILDENQPLARNNFLLRVDAIYDIPCYKVSGIKDEIGYEAIRSGGINDYVYLRKRPVSKQNSFTVERYIGTDFFDPLIVGRALAVPVVLYVSRYQNDFVMPKLTFTFWGCTVTEKSYGDLDSQTSGLMTLTTTISYQKMALITDYLELESVGMVPNFY